MGEVKPSRLRAWGNLVALSFQRQARAHLLVLISLGLLALVCLITWINTRAGRWTMAHWRAPQTGTTHEIYLAYLSLFGMLPWDMSARAVHQAIQGSARGLIVDGTGFFVFSNWIVFSIYASFLLPLWTVAFATEGLGRERESRNLLWVLTRPLPRSSIFLGKFVALLPWCMLLNLGGLWLICQLGGPSGRLAFQVYWPGAVLGTIAFAALFHALSAWLHRPAVAGILYAFFLETIAGNLPGHLKRLSISFYTRCLMFERAHEFGYHPERPSVFLPVSGTTALIVLASATVLFLGFGLWVFSRKEYGDAP